MLFGLCSTKDHPTHMDSSQSFQGYTLQHSDDYEILRIQMVFAEDKGMCLNSVLALQAPEYFFLKIVGFFLL